MVSTSSATDVDATEKDLRCDPDWPLAHLWPVYMGNFHCKMDQLRENAVRKFFVQRKERVHWCFSRNDDFQAIQTRTGVFDMLVYFKTREDAERVIARCHHKMHNGHTLNVFPGWEPVYFPADKTIYYSGMTSQEQCDTFIGYFLADKAKLKVETVVKFHVGVGAVEFATVEARESALTNDRFGPHEQIQPDSVKKQRYIERDVKKAIEAKFKKYPQILKSLKAGQDVTLITAPNLPHLLPKRPPTEYRGEEAKRIHKRVREDLAAGRAPVNKGTTKLLKRSYNKIIQAELAQHNIFE